MAQQTIIARCNERVEQRQPLGSVCTNGQMRTRARQHMHIHLRLRLRPLALMVMVLPLLAVVLSACSVSFDDDAAPTPTPVTEDTLNPLVPTRSPDSTPASGSPETDPVQSNDDADVGWQHGAPVVGGLASTADGQLLLAGTLHRRVLAFGTDGSEEQTYIATTDDDPAWRGGTADVATGPRGRVAFMDADARRITVFSTPDTVALVVPLDPIATPRALTLDADGRLYVAENLPNATSRIRVFDVDGTLLATWERFGEEPLPITIQDLVLTAAGDGVLLLTDDWQGQPAVLALTLDGAAAGEPLVLGSSNVPGERPTSLSALPDGGVVVADPVWRMLVFYNATGDIVRRIPLTADTRGERREISVTTLPDGRVASADAQSGMLLIHSATRVSVSGPTLRTTASHLPCDRIVRVVGVGFRPGETLIRSTVRVGDTVLEGSVLAQVASDGSLALALEPDRWASACLNLEETEIAFDPAGSTLDISALSGDVPVRTQATIYPVQPPPALLLPDEPLICGMRTTVTVSGEGFAPESQLVLEQYDPLTREVLLSVEGTQVSEAGLFIAEFAPAAVPGCGITSDEEIDPANPPLIHLRAYTVRSAGAAYPSAIVTIPIFPATTPTP